MQKEDMFDIIPVLDTTSSPVQSRPVSLPYICRAPLFWPTLRRRFFALPLSSFQLPKAAFAFTEEEEKKRTLNSFEQDLHPAFRTYSRHTQINQPDAEVTFLYTSLPCSIDLYG